MEYHKPLKDVMKAEIAKLEEHPNEALDLGEKPYLKYRLEVFNGGVSHFANHMDIIKGVLQWISAHKTKFKDLDAGDSLLIEKLITAFSVFVITVSL